MHGDTKAELRDTKNELRTYTVQEEAREAYRTSLRGLRCVVFCFVVLCDVERCGVSCDVIRCDMFV